MLSPAFSSSVGLSDTTRIVSLGEGIASQRFHGDRVPLPSQEKETASFHLPGSVSARRRSLRLVPCPANTPGCPGPILGQAAQSLDQHSREHSLTAVAQSSAPMASQLPMKEEKKERKGSSAFPHIYTRILPPHLVLSLPLFLLSPVILSHSSAVTSSLTSPLIYTLSRDTLDNHCQLGFCSG